MYLPNKVEKGLEKYNLIIKDMLCPQCPKRAYAKVFDAV